MYLNFTNTERKSISRNEKQIKKETSPGSENISKELIKYRGEVLDEELTNLFNKIIKHHKTPWDWKNSIKVLTFKKGDKKTKKAIKQRPYKNSIMKLFTTILKGTLIDNSSISEEQQGSIWIYKCFNSVHGFFLIHNF